jgi:subtilisin-like proprotein convertase family protein
VQVTTSFHWVTDGLPHEEATVANILADSFPTNSSESHSLWHGQIEMRTVTYTLYLDKPVEDPAARILGDGVWANAMAKDDHAWPDFAWQPLSQGPSVRKYENPYIEYAALVEAKILPVTLETAPVDAMGSETFTAGDLPKDIPDNAPAGVSSTLTVPAGKGKIRTATLDVDLTHTYIGDLRVVLTRNGQSIVLHDRAGGGTDDLKRSFDLPQLAGQDSAGDFVLSIYDTAAQDAGKLNAWSLDLVTENGGGAPAEPAAEQSGTFAGAGAPKDIPDNSRAGITSTATSTGTGNLTSVKITVDITHPYVGDLVVTLERNGEAIVLHNKAGGSADDLKKTFDVPALVGKPAGGAFTLKVQDLARADKGKLNGWSAELKWR